MNECAECRSDARRMFYMGVASNLVTFIFVGVLLFLLRRWSR